MSDKMQQHTDTQASRRIKYGLNVALAAGVAVVLVALLDWIAYRNNLRYDFTVTREYTLSPQTKQVLGNLDADVEIVTAFPLDTVQLERVDNLVQEYGRASAKVKTDHVDLASKPTAFYARINERFAAVNESMRDAVESARDVLSGVQAQLKTMLDPLTQAADDAGDSGGAVKDRLLEVWAVLTQLDAQITADLEDVQRGLDSPLPDYAGAKRVLLTMMRDQLEAGLLAKMQAFFDQLKAHPAASGAVKNTVIELNERIGPLRDELRAAHEQLASAQGATQYDQLRATLANTPSVVVFKGEAVSVIPVSEMFPDQAVLQQADTDRDARFLGEERLTGALVSLSMDQPPLLVFVVNQQITALGQRGGYNHVAQRLASAGFDVRQWNPQGQMTPDGRMAPPMPPPKPAEGQRAVWIVLPRLPAGPQDFMSANSGEQIASLMMDRLAAGNGVLVMCLPDPSASFGMVDPVAAALEDWNITVQLDRVVLEQAQVPDQKPQANNLLRVSHWPADLPITAALKGMNGLFFQASPIVTAEAEGVTHHALVEVRGSKLWAERDFAGLQSISEATYDEEEAADRFILAVAAAKGDHRLVVVADPAWASDQITTYGRLGQYQGAGLADLGGALYPANAELFVNSVLWLAHLDEMIAASPRSQDIRRIQPMTDSQLNAYRWIVTAGLPAGVLAAGLAVWFVRRKG